MNGIHNISRIFPDSPCILNKESQILVHKYIYSGVKSKEILISAQIQVVPFLCVTINNSRRYVYFMLSILDRNRFFVSLYNLIIWLKLS